MCRLPSNRYSDILPPMNWKTLLLDLRRAGLTQAEIGQAIGLSQPAVSDLVRGRTSTMQWEAGDALIALHAQRCGAVDHEAA